MANSMENLFKESVDTLEQKVFTPTLLTKLAERGYEAKTEADLADLLKCAGTVRENVINGTIIPVPVAQLEADGTMSKAASEKVAADINAFGSEYEVDVAELEVGIKEAGAVLAWGSLAEAKAEAAEAK